MQSLQLIQPVGKVFTCPIRKEQVCSQYSHKLPAHPFMFKKYWSLTSCKCSYIQVYTATTWKNFLQPWCPLTYGFWPPLLSVIQNLPLNVPRGLQQGQSSTLRGKGLRKTKEAGGWEVGNSWTDNAFLVLFSGNGLRRACFGGRAWWGGGV